MKIISTFVFILLATVSNPLMAIESSCTQDRGTNDVVTFIDYYFGLARSGEAVFPVDVSEVGGIEGDIGFIQISYICQTSTGVDMTVSKPVDCGSCYPGGGLGTRVPTPVQVWASCASCVTSFPKDTANRSIVAVCGPWPGIGSCPYPSEPSCI